MLSRGHPCAVYNNEAKEMQYKTEDYNVPTVFFFITHIYKLLTNMFIV